MGMNLKEKSEFTKLVLGRGGFGKVYRYKKPGSGQQLAIKVEEKVAMYVCLRTCNLYYFQFLCGL